MSKKKSKFSKITAHTRVEKNPGHKSNKATSNNKQHQQTIIATLSSSESKKHVINDLIKSFIAASIPVEKIDS
ncbi:6356_t:CDS:2 [Gigaspora rosea]|nr:6356_t:CDS:2 [Gigaspora rosea]